MYTNSKGCTVYEKTVYNRSPTYVRHCTKDVYIEENTEQTGGSDRISNDSTLIIMPNGSFSYCPKKDDRIVCDITDDEQPPSNALTVMSVKKRLYGSERVRHIEVIEK